MAEDAATLLEGLDEKAPRHEMLRIARVLASKVHAQEDARLGRMQDIEERVRRDYAGRNETLIQIIATSSESEWDEAIDFLDNWQELLPVALYRVYDGARMALGKVPEVEPPAEPDDAATEAV